MSSDKLKAVRERNARAEFRAQYMRDTVDAYIPERDLNYVLKLVDEARAEVDRLREQIRALEKERWYLRKRGD